MGDRDDLGDCPDEGGKFTSDGDNDLVDVFAAGTERPIAFTQAHLRIPGQVLQFLGQMSDALL